MRIKSLILRKAVVLIVCAIALATSPSVSSQRKSNPTELAKIEAYVKEIDAYAKQNSKAGRIFANVASGIERVPDKWLEFKSEGERYNADSGDNLNENSTVWLKSGKVVVAYFMFQSPSRDWAHYVTYYFRPDGTLVKIISRLNTFYGDISVIREKSYDVNGRPLKSSVQYLDLKTKRKKKPGSNFIDEPIPMYKRIKNLPFIHLLKAQYNKAQEQTRN